MAEVPPADLASVEPGRAGQLLVDGRHALFVRANNTFAYGDADHPNVARLSSRDKFHNAESIANFAFEAKFGRPPAHKT